MSPLPPLPEHWRVEITPQDELYTTPVGLHIGGLTFWLKVTDAELLAQHLEQVAGDARRLPPPRPPVPDEFGE